MQITYSRREIIAFYLLIAILDLLLILINTSWGQVGLTPDTGTPNMFRLFLQNQLDPTQEQNLATWYSSSLLLLTGLIAWINCKSTSPWRRMRRAQQVCWVLIGLLFVWLSADETASVHENLAALLNLEISNPAGRFRVGAGDWIPILLPFIIGSIILLFIFSVFLFARRLRLLFLPMSGMICWLGVLFFESAEGNPQGNAVSGLVTADRSRRLTEESLEFIGTTLFLIAFIEFYRWRGPIGKSGESGESGESPQSAVDCSRSSPQSGG